MRSGHCFPTLSDSAEYANLNESSGAGLVRAQQGKKASDETLCAELWATSGRKKWCR